MLDDKLYDYLDECRNHSQKTALLGKREQAAAFFTLVFTNALRLHCFQRHPSIQMLMRAALRLKDIWIYHKWLFDVGSSEPRTAFWSVAALKRWFFITCSATWALEGF